MFKKFLRALNQHLEEYLIALFLIAITFVMLLQIVMRYVLLASGDNRHSGSGEKRQFWSTENSHLQFE